MHRLHVAIPVATICESHGADLTHERLLAHVRPPVRLHVLLPREGLLAEVAGEGPLSGVRPPVRLHGLLLRERLAAEVAGKRPLARVRADVAVEV